MLCGIRLFQFLNQRNKFNQNPASLVIKTLFLFRIFYIPQVVFS